MGKTTEKAERKGEVQRPRERGRYRDREKGGGTETERKREVQRPRERDKNGDRLRHRERGTAAAPWTHKKKMNRRPTHTSFLFHVPSVEPRLQPDFPHPC